jgi:hypothetical protein
MVSNKNKFRRRKSMKLRKGGSMNNRERQEANGKLNDIFYIEQEISQIGFDGAISGLFITNIEKKKLKDESIHDQAIWIYNARKEAANQSKLMEQEMFETGKTREQLLNDGLHNEEGVFRRLNKGLTPAEQKAENNRESAQLSRVTKRKNNALKKHAKRMQRGKQ